MADSDEEFYDVSEYIAPSPQADSKLATAAAAPASQASGSTDSRVRTPPAPARPTIVVETPSESGHRRTPSEGVQTPTSTSGASDTMKWKTLQKSASAPFSKSAIDNAGTNDDEVVGGVGNAALSDNTETMSSDAGSSMMHEDMHERPPQPHDDEEADILKYMVKNLDTGETFKIDEAERKIPKPIDPLSLHLQQRMPNTGDDGHEPPSPGSKTPGSKSGEGQKKPGWLSMFSRGKGEAADDESPDNVKSTPHRKVEKHFADVTKVQQLTDHVGAVWTMKFSPDGRYLATGGQDMVVRVWVVTAKASASSSGKTAPTPRGPEATPVAGGSVPTETEREYFAKKPYHLYYGHSADVLDLAWSKSNMLLSSSMDKTVRLWHISMDDCLCCFQHVDFVTSIAFHPEDNKLFLSGSLDEKLRIWSIPDKRVAHWVDNRDLVTAVAFSPDGKFAIAGSYGGKCTFYEAEGLRYVTQLHVRSKRGRNARGKKITGIEVMPGGNNKLLITSNDSRVRLYNMHDYSLYCKYKGLDNESSQIRASFSNQGNYIICGSEDQQVYLWKTIADPPPGNAMFGRARRDRNDSYEYFQAHKSIVTVALFAPLSMEGTRAVDETSQGLVMVTAEYRGLIQVFENKDRDKDKDKDKLKPV